MTRREVIASLGGAGLAALLSGCSELSKAKFCFRMTVEVETPQGLKTGSSVMQVAGALPTLTLPESNKFIIGLIGEAVAVDLPGGRTLFALLKSNDTIEGSAIWAFHPEARGYPDKMMAAMRDLSAPASLGRGATLARQKYPILVTFTDPHDPKSVQAVDPDDLAKSFGPGVKLKRITIQITGNPVTTGIEKRLPKPDEKGFYGMQILVDGQRKLAALGQWEFSKGVQK